MSYCGLPLLVVLLSWQLSATTSDELDPHNAAVQGINTFSKSLYEVLSKKPGDIVVSPFSVEAVVAMLLLGLEGDTATQVSAALHLPKERSQVAEGFKSLFQSLQNTGDITLKTVNKLYIQKGFDIKEKYLNSTKEYFNSVTEGADIQGAPEQVRLAVNSWASQNTNGKIKDLLAPGDLEGEVFMILLNAIYFKGMWHTAFKMEYTRDEEFHLTPSSSKNVPMMHLNANLRYADLNDYNVQVLQLPYKGRKHSMLILLPKSVDGLQDFESNIKELDISRIRNSMWLRDVIVTLPRFKILQTIDLQEPLQKLGMGVIFSPGGNFTGITEETVYVSKALQKAFIEVNEEGTEAAAVTAVTGLQVTSISQFQIPPVEFTADHPFMYMIIEEDKGTILFMGRVTEPKETE